MMKSEWKEHYGVYDVDMTLIETVVEQGGKITEVDRLLLDYEIVKFSS